MTMCAVIMIVSAPLHLFRRRRRTDCNHTFHTGRSMRMTVIAIGSCRIESVRPARAFFLQHRAFKKLRAFGHSIGHGVVHVFLHIHPFDGVSWLDRKFGWLKIINLLGIQIGDHFNGVFLGHGLRSNGHKGHQNSP